MVSKVSRMVEFRGEVLTICEVKRAVAQLGVVRRVMPPL